MAGCPGAGCHVQLKATKLQLQHALPAVYSSAELFPVLLARENISDTPSPHDSTQVLNSVPDDLAIPILSKVPTSLQAQTRGGDLGAFALTAPELSKLLKI